MITPQDIKKQCLGWWHDLLLSVMNGEEFFPREIVRIGKITSRDILLKLTEYKMAITELQHSADLWGYEVEMSEKNFEKIGSQTIPVSIRIPSSEVYLRITRKKSELDSFLKNRQFIRYEMPELIEWCHNNPLRLISHDTWRETLLVCRYFRKHPHPELYIRQLPIDIHTKYIEENKDLLRSLLDTLLPTSDFNPEEKTFEKRYGLKTTEPLIRIRFLDSRLSPASGWTDISLPLSDFHRMDCPCKHILITENKMNFLCLPSLPDSIAVWSGGGFNISYLKDISWLKQAQCYYWGDLDAQGLQILNQFRNYYPSARALMMDWNTLRYYQHLLKEGTPAPLQVLPQLTVEEQELYRYLQEYNLRLEQERIPDAKAVEEIVREIHTVTLRN